MSHAGGGVPLAARRGELPSLPGRLDALAPEAAHAGVWRCVQRWCRDYLCTSDPELGRAGPVCPYVPAAWAAGRLFAAVWPGRLTSRSEVVEGMRAYRCWFERALRDGHHALLVLFPDLDTEQGRWLVDSAQRELKTEFVERGLMVGEFHSGPPEKPGLHNRAFRPLRGPIPLLAIRDMVCTDLPFLLDHPRHHAAHVARFGR